MRIKGQELAPGVFAEEPTRAHMKSYIMGTTVLAMKYKDGVMLATDTQLSYGSYGKYNNIERSGAVSKNTFLASSGEYSNFQELLKVLRVKTNPPGDKEVYMGPRECFELVKNHMYGKRCKGTPELNTHVVAGIEGPLKSRVLPYEHDPSGKFLGVVDHLGNFYYDSIVGTGIGAHLALPILRAQVGENTEMSEEEAHKILVSVMTTLYYRDTRASPSIQISKVTKEGITVSKPFMLKTSWEIADIL
ncbi:20S proteasome subunit beta 7 [Nematocida major]|uniref:20S proteasome subunit beta 7 n=1 Tax=Nematocida major TaxID=1912982 RepID=UPI00200720DC|nr:20S proteasome subunit beta 7 [Nematocida major]KAH9386446.1 20S proteasome subunit beta 7 [Nematocida major]